YRLIPSGRAPIYWQALQKFYQRLARNSSIYLIERMQELALVMAGGRLDAPEEQLALLVKRAKSGEIAAFEEILGRYERQVLGTALRLLGRNLEDAKDAAQQVFLGLHGARGQLEEIRKSEARLYG